MTPEPAVLVERQDTVAIVRLNRPQQLNAINAAMRIELPAALRPLNSDAAVRAVVIAGAGERAFSAGQDLDEAAGYGIDDVDRWFTELWVMHGAVRAMDKPVVAAIVGVAAGAGFQIGLYCDVRVSHPEAKIGQPEIKMGIASILGTSAMRWHLPFGINAELSLSGDLISGERAERLGLVNHLVARKQVMTKAVEVAKLLGSRPPAAIRLTKEHARELTQAQFEGMLDAVKRFQRRAYESGEPQRMTRAFVAAKRK